MEPKEKSLDLDDLDLLVVEDENGEFSLIDYEVVDDNEPIPLSKRMNPPLELDWDSF